MTPTSGTYQGSIAITISLLRVCSSGEQESHHLHVTIRSSPYQGSPAILISLLHICSCSQQALHHLRAALLTGTPKSRTSHIPPGYLIHVSELAPLSIVCRRVQIIEIFLPESSHQLHKHRARSVLPLVPEREAPQVDAPLPRPLQLLVITTLPVLVPVAIEGGRLHALVGLHQVQPGLAVRHGTVQTPHLLHREVGDGARLDGVRQRVPHQLAPSQRLPILHSQRVQSSSRLCGVVTRGRHVPEVRSDEQSSLSSARSLLITYTLCVEHQ